MALLNPDISKQMKHRERDMVPRALVVAMFGLMAVTLAIVTFARVTDKPLTGVASQESVTKSLQITLEGSRSDGVAVLGLDGKELAFSMQEKAGFIDVIWMATSRERKVQGVTGNPPLNLVRRSDGRTAILDPATGWSIELIGYGADNVAAFARLLD